MHLSNLSFLQKILWDLPLLIQFLYKIGGYFPVGFLLGVKEK